MHRGKFCIANTSNRHNSNNTFRRCCQFQYCGQSSAGGGCQQHGVSDITGNAYFVSTLHRVAVAIAPLACCCIHIGRSLISAVALACAFDALLAITHPSSGKHHTLIHTFNTHRTHPHRSTLESCTDHSSNSSHPVVIISLRPICFPGSFDRSSLN